jgi:iron complex transport system ATP-binding protein
MLSVTNLSFAYHETPVLSNVSFDVASGEIVAVLGPNGAGKTTLLKAIHGLIKARSGSVHIDALDVGKSRLREIARTISYTPQQDDRAHITSFDAILLGRKPYFDWGPSGGDYRRVEQVLGLFNLEGFSERYIDEMSGGEYQKICVARSFAQDPALMLLDEPTSSLDLRNQIDLLNLLRRIVREHPIAVVMSIHDINLALRYVDSCLFIKKGTVKTKVPVMEIDADLIEDVYGIKTRVVHFEGRPIVVPLEETENMWEDL